MYNFKIHKLFILLAAFLIFKGQAIFLVNSTLTVLLHEMAHARVAYGRGYVMNRIVLMPYGAVLYGEEKMKKEDAVAIALAGPLFNVFIAVLLFALWWLVPTLYVFTDSFAYANLSVAFFNLIPVFPLDGSRVVLALSENKPKTLKKLKFFGVLAAFLLFAFFIYSAFFEINITAGVMAVFLYFGAVSGTQKEMYTYFSDLGAGVKNTLNGVEKRSLFVSEKTRLVKLIRMMNENTLTDFTVVNEKFESAAMLTERDLEEIAMTNDANAEIGEILKKRNGISRR
ncbi:MAG: site-2 protease family protein [Clostridiales bacterium]|jgi:stage IV sporulation protein FB|nr:site-2 protease family protein [Clostridiales bacterium]